ncbi:MAG: group III truncated hemoglobin [Pyrinomonadaceae bacterium]
MKKDIENRSDIDQLMNAFYSRALADDLIGFIFTDVAKLDLEHHLPVIGDFWETLLFQTGEYARHGRNPMRVHAALDLKTPLLPRHFERWLEIFTGTVDKSFEGERADHVKLRAAAIANNILRYLDREPLDIPDSELNNYAEEGGLAA